MSTPPVAITGIGLVSALGLDAVIACAAARAGLNRLRALDVLQWSAAEAFGGEPVAGHAVPLVASGFVGFAKTLALAHHALADLFARTPLASAEAAHFGLVLLVSDGFLEDRLHDSDADEDLPPPSQRWRAEAARLVPLLARLAGLPPARCRIVHGHHAEFAEALALGVEAIARQRLQGCLVGALDCAFEPQRLIAAAEAELLKTAGNPVGHLPGEAGGFVLLEAAGRSGGRRKALASLGGLERRRTRAWDPEAAAPDGSELAAALIGALPPAPTPGWFVGDLNGEAARAQEWGEVLVRVQLARAGAADWPLELPALAFGETGAAAGVVGTAFALHQFARRCAPPGSALLALASDNGARAALRLDPPAGG